MHGEHRASCRNFFGLDCTGATAHQISTSQQAHNGNGKSLQQLRHASSMSLQQGSSRTAGHVLRPTILENSLQVVQGSGRHGAAGGSQAQYKVGNTRRVWRKLCIVHLKRHVGTGRVAARFHSGHHDGAHKILVTAVHL
jgi:hypothetical protein